MKRFVAMTMTVLLASAASVPVQAQSARGEMERMSRAEQDGGKGGDADAGVARGGGERAGGERAGVERGGVDRGQAEQRSGNDYAGQAGGGRNFGGERGGNGGGGQNGGYNGGFNGGFSGGVNGRPESSADYAGSNQNYTPYAQQESRESRFERSADRAAYGANGGYSQNGYGGSHGQNGYGQNNFGGGRNYGGQNYGSNHYGGNGYGNYGHGDRWYDERNRDHDRYRDWNGYHNHDWNSGPYYYGYNWNHHYRAPSYYTRPYGYYSRSWRVGYSLPRSYYGSSYYIDYRPYGLAPPPYGYRWIRVDDDVFLVAIASGLIADIVSDLFYYD